MASSEQHTVSTADQQTSIWRWCSTAGIIGPILFASVTMLLFVVQRGFLVHHNADPTINVYPSANSRGPYGWVQILAFILSGILVVPFAFSLYRAISHTVAAKIAVGLLLLAGLALILDGLFTIDLPISSSGQAPTATLHGTIHVIAYAVLGIAAFLAYVLLFWPLRKSPGWGRYGLYSLLSGVAMVAFYAAGTLLGETHTAAIAVYLFFIVFLAWFVVVALRLLALSR